MLTADLLDYRRRQGRITPRLLDPDAPAVREAGQALADLFRAHLGRPHGELDEALRAVAFPALPPRAGPGLARLLLERCRFEVAATAHPPALRAAVFDAAAQAWRTDPAAGTPAWRAAVLARVAAAQGLAPAEAEAALFADLEEHQRLLELDALGPQALAWRYNVAQVQGLLLRAERLELHAPWPEPRRLRQLLRWMKFFGLLYREEPAAPAPGGAPTLCLVVDGPLSVLESATRYGLELAQFYPALLLWEQPWRLDAHLRLGRGSGRGAGRAAGKGLLRPPERLLLEPHPWLRSHYPDHGQWVSDAVRAFLERFNDGPGPWRAEAAEALLPAPGNRSLVPDFAFQRPGAEPVYLEHLAYPAAETVQARLALLDAAGRSDYLLACRAVPAVQSLGAHRALLAYRRSLLPSQVREALGRLRP